MLKQSKIIYSGLDSLENELRKEEWHGARYSILVDENTSQDCLPVLVGNVEELQEAELIEVPTGEECKTLEVAAQVWQTLLEGGADRDTVLVGLGGGAVCDLCGFVSAGYKRGIRHILVPTTLLAMTDAAIGGKTAIDFGGVKNSIGHFYPTALTIIDTDFLETLPTIEVANGLMEMVKTAAVCDPELYSQITNTRGRMEISRRQVTAVVRLKARVVKADPYDHSIRKILNFGHTFGHAIEMSRKVPHGLAVGIGMKAAMYHSTKKTGLAAEVYNTYSKWLDSIFSTIGIHFSDLSLRDIEQMLPLMHQDKKNTADRLRCVLLQELGAPVIDVEVSDNEVRDAMLKVTR